MLFALYSWRTNEFILRTISWLACASALQILPSRDHLEPFLSLFVIFPATRGKIYPHLDKKFWLCRDGFISVATKNIGQGQKPVSAWLDIFQLYLSQIDNFISRTFSRLARTAVQKCSQPKPFPFPFVIFPAARGKIYPHLDKKFWLCRDGFISVATKNIEQRQKPVSVWLDIFWLYLPHTDNFISQTFSHFTRSIFPKLLLSKALSVSIRHNSRRAGENLSPFG